ncbi:hypothetical protein H5410_045711 [Solanum commersonii]|uniref:Uncharacterized protein n=1 Tax=Solanum commersonii TaxID=4109 RepID=A0A9J5XCD7_SOLCO|nr:hypothetical protein H5410_045711 [Solanum commersonii]
MYGWEETPINLQEGVTKGRGELPHVVHEDVAEFSSDYRDPNTPILRCKTTGQQGGLDTGQQEDKFNNKSGGRLSKKRRDAIKKKQIADQVSERGIQIEEQDVNKDKSDRPPQYDYGGFEFRR